MSSCIIVSFPGHEEWPGNEAKTYSAYYSLPQYVFTASELPSFFPIPQHIEMSFLPAPPRKLFFCCLEAPTSTGGETCLCDFKKVYDQLDPKVRDTFEEKGVSVLVILILSPVLVSFPDPTLSQGEMVWWSWASDPHSQSHSCTK